MIDLNSMKILVTGATGRLGSSVCRLLSQAGIPFQAVDKVPGQQTDYAVEIVDLLDSKKCSLLLEGVDVLMHFANHSNWYKGSPQKVFNENVTMNMNLFQAAADRGCQRIVFSSSIQVINGQLPIHERADHKILLPYLPMDSDMPAIPRNSYALSKHTSENMLTYFSENRGMTCIVIRYPWLLDAHLMKSAIDNQGIKRGKCYDGYAYLPLYSGAEVAIKAMTASLSGYHQYFVASKDNLEQRPAQEVIAEQLAHLPHKKPIQEMNSLIDCSKAERELGWKQPESLKTAYEKYGKLEDVMP